MRWQPWPVRIEAKLDRVIANLQSFKEAVMSDLSHLTTALTDLQTEVAAIGTQMDANFAALKAALAGGDQAAIDAATASIEAQVQALRDIGTRDTVTPPPAP
jgi:uncharacterized protein YqgV (UPF0045/DUF77 family)